MFSATRLPIAPGGPLSSIVQYIGGLYYPATRLREEQSYLPPYSRRGLPTNKDKALYSYLKPLRGEPSRCLYRESLRATRNTR